MFEVGNSLTIRSKRTFPRWVAAFVVLQGLCLWCANSAWADYVNAADYATLNEAVSAAVAEGKTGVHIPADHTTTATTMYLPNDFVIVGADMDTSIVSFTSMSGRNGFVGAGGGGASGVQLKNFTIDTSHATAASDSPYSAVVHLGSASNVVVEGIKFIEPPTMAVMFGANDNLVKNCQVTGAGFISMFVHGSRSKVIGNTISGGASYGISSGGTGMQIRGNHISEMKSVGIFISGLSKSLIEGNTVKFIADHCISGDGATTHHNAIMNNHVEQAGVLGGQAVNSEVNGITLWLGPESNLIQGNTLPNNLGYGIAVVGHESGVNTPNNIVSQNEVSNTGDPAILVNCATGNVVRKNISRDNPSTGFTIGHDGGALTCTGTLVLNNQAINNMLEGMDINGVSEGVIMGNVCKNNGTGSWEGHVKAGMRLTHGTLTFNNKVIGNTSRDAGANNQQYGIYLEGDVHGNTVAYNDLHANTVAALKIDNPELNTERNNRTGRDTTPLAAALPLADAGLGKLLEKPGTADLDGAGSRLMVGKGSMTYAWEQILGPTVEISDADAAQASFEIPLTEEIEILGFRLTVSNGNGSTYDQVYFAVVPMTPTPKVEPNAAKESGRPLEPAKN